MKGKGGVGVDEDGLHRAATPELHFFFTCSVESLVVAFYVSLQCRFSVDPFDQTQHETT